MASQEITVSARSPVPKGYSFLPKGDRYKTMHCRRSTLNAGKTVYVVQEKKKTLGICIPKEILCEIKSLAKKTAKSRRQATDRRENAFIREASAEIDKLFPRIPDCEKSSILTHGFAKNSRRVGRTRKITNTKKVMLAVTAHIRHKHTDYDKKLREGMERKKARSEIKPKVEQTMKMWRAKSRSEK